MLIVPGKGQNLILPNRQQRRAAEDELPREEKIKRERLRQHEQRTIKMMARAKPHFELMLDKHVPTWAKKLASIVFPKWYSKYVRIGLANFPPMWWGYATSRMIGLIFGLPMNAVLRYAFTLLPALLTPAMILTGLVASVARMALYAVLVMPFEWAHKRLLRWGITIRCEEDATAGGRMGILIIKKWGYVVDRSEWNL